MLIEICRHWEAWKFTHNNANKFLAHSTSSCANTLDRQVAVACKMNERGVKWEGVEESGRRACRMLLLHFVSSSCSVVCNVLGCLPVCHGLWLDSSTHTRTHLVSDGECVSVPKDSNSISSHSSSRKVTCINTLAHASVLKCATLETKLTHTHTCTYTYALAHTCWPFRSLPPKAGNEMPTSSLSISLTYLGWLSCTLSVSLFPSLCLPLSLRLTLCLLLVSLGFLAKCWSARLCILYAKISKCFWIC